MKPPICEVCGDRFEPSAGGLVGFADRPQTESTDAGAGRSAAEGLEAPGHPRGEGWFCSLHLEAAREAAVSMTFAEALRHMIEPVDPTRSTGEVTLRIEPAPPAPTPSEPASPNAPASPEQGGLVAPSPDNEFANIDVRRRSIPGRVATDVAEVMRSALPGLATALGVSALHHVGSVGSRTVDQEDQRWVRGPLTCSSNSAMFRSDETAVFIITARHLDGTEVEGEHARLVVQRSGRSLIEAVAVAAPSARFAADRRMLLEELQIRTAGQAASELIGQIDALAEMLSTAGVDPLDPAPDLVDVDLCGGQIRRGVATGDSSVAWDVPGLPLAEARQRFLGVVPELFEAHALGDVPELVVSTHRSWTPMDGSRPPHCPFTDLVRHEASSPDGRALVSVSSDQAHWNEHDIDNVSCFLFVDVSGVRVSAFASGRGNHDICNSLTLRRPTSATVVAALAAAFGLGASGPVESG